MFIMFMRRLNYIISVAHAFSSTTRVHGQPFVFFC